MKTNIFMFIVGAVAGSFVTFKLLDEKYEKRAQDEIDAYINSDISEAQSKSEDAKNKPDISEYIKQTVGNEYVNYSAISEKEEEEVVDKPYVIEPEEFGEKGYSQISLTYYDDGILAEDDKPIDDVEDTVGADSLTHFGEYEDDSVFVRNDRLRIDFEILLDHRLYADILKTMPHPITEE